jgi:hypothetical protein
MDAGCKFRSGVSIQPHFSVYQENIRVEWSEIPGPIVHGKPLLRSASMLP